MARIFVKRRIDDDLNRARDDLVSGNAVLARFLCNELRIDAAGGGEAKEKGHCAAASVRVGLSRIWKKKPGVSGKTAIRTQRPPIKAEPGWYFT